MTYKKIALVISVTLMATSIFATSKSMPNQTPLTALIQEEATTREEFSKTTLQLLLNLATNNTREIAVRNNLATNEITHTPLSTSREQELTNQEQERVQALTNRIINQPGFKTAYFNFLQQTAQSIVTRVSSGISNKLTETQRRKLTLENSALAVAEAAEAVPLNLSSKLIYYNIPCDPATGRYQVQFLVDQEVARTFAVAFERELLQRLQAL